MMPQPIGIAQLTKLSFTKTVRGYSHQKAASVNVMLITYWKCSIHTLNWIAQRLRSTKSCRSMARISFLIAACKIGRVTIAIYLFICALAGLFQPAADYLYKRLYHLPNLAYSLRVPRITTRLPYDCLRFVSVSLTNERVRELFGPSMCAKMACAMKHWTAGTIYN